MRLSGKVALITGATGGIGEATARLFATEGAALVLVGRNAEKLAALRVDGDTAVMVAEADDEAGIASAVRLAEERFGGLDILFANAGTEGPTTPLEQVTRADFDRVLAVNVVGPWLALKHAAPALRRRGGGSVIITSSVLGGVGAGLLVPYAASKHAVMGMVKSAAVELAGAGIRVNAIQPGPIDNRMIASIEEQVAPGHGAAVRAQLMQKIALRRYGTNEEVARMALFLASGESAYCTGGGYAVDGGYLAE